ncbi:spore germination protein [Paenibacillus sp. LjRoot153]|uniref:spore germination protein n=1 Tax=Paenibacillus sp. LjRoot153 TaxID=3342270 RepID=UPI003ECEF95B
MPAIINGGIKILNVTQGSNVQIGDTLVINLTSSSKIFAGANSFSPGDSFGSVQNVLNGSNNTVDPDLVDTPNNTI